MIDPDRLVAPPQHLGVLVEPAGPALQEQARRDGDKALRSIAILDTDAASLREELRDALRLPRGPLVATGHQAEFFHAGVFAKSLAAETLSEGGQPFVFVLVDSDLPRTDRIVFPRHADGTWKRESVPIPGVDPRLPVESNTAAPREEWRALFDALKSFAPPGNMLAPFAEGWLSGCDAGLAGAFAAGLSGVERELGLRGARYVLVSQMSETASFRAFVAHLARHALALASEYNKAQLAYRRRRRVRNKARPAPPLEITRDAVELPFWAYRDDQPRRRVFVRRGGDSALLVEDEPLGSAGEKMADLCRPWKFEAAGWRVRPRALALSAFMRLLLADVFIHGIGGAKYDEMTDEFAAGFFGAAPPPLACVTATAYLADTPSEPAEVELRAARNAVRDLRYNPQRHGIPAPPALAARREELLALQAQLRRQEADGATRRERRRVYEELRALQAEWSGRSAEARERLELRIAQLEAREAAQRVALDREAFFAFHTRDTLLELARRLRAAIGANS